MNDLFVSLYLDENVSLLVGSLLASLGFRALNARDAGRRGASDSEQLSYAAERGMAIMTHDRGDFEELHRQYLASGQTHAGIVIVFRHNRGPYEIAGRVRDLLNALTADEMRNQLIYI